MIRAKSPLTRIYVNEFGTMLPNDIDSNTTSIWADSFQNSAAAAWAYGYLWMSYKIPELAVVGMSQLIGHDHGEALMHLNRKYYPSLSMLDWKTGEPFARHSVLRMLVDDVPVGGELIYPARNLTTVIRGVDGGGSGEVFSMEHHSFNNQTRKIERRFVLINKSRYHTSVMVWVDSLEALMDVKYVDSSRGPPRSQTIRPANKERPGVQLGLRPFAVAVARPAAGNRRRA